MKFEIKHRWTGSILFSIETDSLKLAVEAAVKSGAYLRGAYLRGAYLRGADLGGAYLGDADLRGAYLWGADLGGADLGDAYLGDAYLGGADLRGAKGIHPEISTPLRILLEQPGKIRAYKLVNAENIGPFNGGITYEVGKSYEVKDADTNADQDCGAGINVATLQWCLQSWQEGYKVLIVEFTAKDIACIPNGTDGKFRLYRCDVVAKKDITEMVDSLKLPEKKASK